MNTRITRAVTVVRRVVVAVLLGFFVLVVGGAVITLLGITPESSKAVPWLGPFYMHTTMLVVSILLMVLLSRVRLAAWGFMWSGISRLRKVVVWSLGVGTVGAVIQTTLFPMDIPVAQQFTFGQIVVFIWIYASICEEVLTRGLIQGYLAPLRELGFRVFRIRLSLPVMVSALFFSLIHLAAVGDTTSISAVLIFLLFAATLGTMAGYYREQTGSLLPAVAVHMMFNVSGSLVDYLV